MVIVMMVMLVGSLVSIGAWQSATGDIRPARKTVSDQRAYAAAQAGVADYLQKLGLDNEYWLKCTNVPALPDGSPAPINQVTANPLRWRTLNPQPNVGYAIELLPRSGYSGCQENADASMLNTDGTIQIRATGRSGAPGTREERHRSLVTTLRRKGFLDFLYFTMYETRDPLQRDSLGYPVKPCLPAVGCAPLTVTDWADQATTCRRYVRDGRNTARYQGSYLSAGTWYEIPDAYEPTCGSIQFIAADAVAGPLHTNDTISLCGQPKFGRNRAGATTEPIDRIEYWGYAQTCSGAGPDNGNNTVKTGVDPTFEVLDLPESNSQLLQVALDGGIVYSGQTEITLTGTTMTVKTANGVTTNNVALPGNGVIYVQGGTNASYPTCAPFDVRNPYLGESTGQQQNCGDAIVKGTYGMNLTIAAARDVQVAGNTVGANNSLLGLIANSLVRVRHVMASYPCGSGTANSVALPNVVIEAAMLSLGHVFTVDSYECGASMGELNVTGAIAQKYRGPVGTSGSSSTGYIKDYRYDNRMRFRSPPYFLAPVQSAWRVVRTTEQVPPR